MSDLPDSPRSQRLPPGAITGRLDPVRLLRPAAVHTGSPGFGGYGGDLYVMREDGSHPYRLTTNSDPDDGSPYTVLERRPLRQLPRLLVPGRRPDRLDPHRGLSALRQAVRPGKCCSATSPSPHGVPSLQDVQVVGKPYGVYETQPWAPDGSWLSVSRPPAGSPRRFSQPIRAGGICSSTSCVCTATAPHPPSRR